MGARDGGYYGIPFKGCWGVTQGDPLSPPNIQRSGGRYDMAMDDSCGNVRVGVLWIQEVSAEMK